MRFFSFNLELICTCEFFEKRNCTRRSGSCNFSFLKNSLVQINSKLNSKPYDYRYKLHSTQFNDHYEIRVRFFKKIQDWILKSERIRKRILRFFTRQINPRSLGSWRVKGTEESSLKNPSNVGINPYTSRGPYVYGLIPPFSGFISYITHRKLVVYCFYIIIQKTRDFSVGLPAQ